VRVGGLWVRAWTYLGVSMVLLFCAASLDAQNKCPPETPNDWLTRGGNSGLARPIDPELVLPVASELPRAISLLSRRSAVLISSSDVQRFTGRPAAPSAKTLRPYLVRALDVSRWSAPKLSVEQGNLEVFVGRLGCPLHTKTPVVVFLREPPKRVFVEVMTAL
jgi:hypothetical protein